MKPRFSDNQEQTTWRFTLTWANFRMLADIIAILWRGAIQVLTLAATTALAYWIATTAGWKPPTWL